MKGGKSSTKSATSSKKTVAVKRSEKQQRLVGVRIVRGCILGSIPVGIGAALEIKARPLVPSDYDTFVQSLPDAPYETAKALLEQAQQAAAEGRYEEAVELYSGVLRTSPRSYVLCMKSLLGRRDALFALDRRAEGGEDTRREWLWGRGIRWPGWYIIAAIVLRNEIMDD